MQLKKHEKRQVILLGDTRKSLRYFIKYLSPYWKGITLVVLFTVIFTFTSIVQIYFCIALGQLFQEHRVLLAIAFYFLAGFGVQILTTSLLLITGLIRPQMFADSYSFNMGRYTDILYLITGILSIILAVIEYMVTNYIMKRKINLI